MGSGQETGSRHIRLLGPGQDPGTGLSGDRWEAMDLGLSRMEGLTQSSDSQTKTTPVSLAGWLAPSPGPELLPSPV